MKLYSDKILKLATEIPNIGKLKNAEKEISLRSPICGSKITIYINMSSGQISEYKQEIKACALGQASASIFGLNAIGQDYQREIFIIDGIILNKKMAKLLSWSMVFLLLVLFGMDFSADF